MDKQEKEIIEITNENPSKLDNIFLTKTVLNALKGSNFQQLSPLQHTSLPLGISGFDLIVKEPSGTSRFVLYAILALELIKIDLNHAQVLILAPQEEVHMIRDIIFNLGQYLEGLKISTFDDKTEDDVNITSCHVVIVSANKLKSFVDLRTLKTDNIRLLILDNSNKLMNSDNFPIYVELFKLLPDKKQIISFSSSYSKGLQGFLKKYTNHPLEINHEIESSVLLGFNQFVCTINQPQDYVLSITEAKTNLLCSILSKISFTHCIIYTNDESKGVYITKIVQEKGWNSFFAPFFINDSEMRKKIKKSKCLISTTYLDTKKFNWDVNLIINYDIPLESAAYIERIGKVKNDTKGIYISLVSPGEELERFERILGEIGGTEMSVPKLDIDDGYFEDIWNVETSCLDHICGITKDLESQTENEENLKKVVSDIIKYRLEQTEEDNVASKLKDLSVAHKNHINSKSSKLKSLLEELASGKVSTDEKNDRISTNDPQNDKKLPELKTLLEIFTSEINNEEKIICNGKEEEIKNTNVNSLLQSLALGNTTHDTVINNIKNNDDILTRNVALLNVAKLVTNCDNLQEEEISKDITQPLDGYLNTLKKTEVTSIESDSSEVSVSNQKNSENKEDNNFHLKDIFKIGYDFLIKPISSFKSTDETRNDLEKQFPECNELGSEILDDTPDLVTENKITAKADKRKTKSQKNKNKNSKRSKFCEEYNDTENNELTVCKEENLTLQESVEVNDGMYTLTETGNSIDRVAESYFDYYSNILWNDGLTFDDVPTFDNWFAQWQAQVQSVRDYVQQKIYLEEMNKFQQN